MAGPGVMMVSFWEDTNAGGREERGKREEKFRRKKEERELVSLQ